MSFITDLNRIRKSLKADCEKCFGLCCTALYFSKQDGFPADKEAGKLCKNLTPDYKCKVHKDLKALGLKGCMAYDCLGAGQKTVQNTYKGEDFIRFPDKATQMFEVFLVIKDLHELLWYLAEAMTLEEAASLHHEIAEKLAQTESLTKHNAEEILALDLGKHWIAVNDLLMRVSELVRGKRDSVLKLPFKVKKTFAGRADLFACDLRKADLRGASLRGACLVAADLRGLDLTKTDFIGADLRDAKLQGANLFGSIFLNQAQINSAMGDSGTTLPKHIVRPVSWK